MTKQQNAVSWRSALLAGTAAAFATGAAMPAMAADNAKVITSSSEKVKVRITGQINRAVIYYDDDFHDGIKHVDNDFSSTRFRWHADAKVNNDIKIGGIMEIQAESNSGLTTALQDTEGPSDSASLTDRRLEFWIHHNQLGRVYVGKGDTATNNSSLSTAHAGGVANLTAAPWLGVGGLSFKSNGGSCTTSGTGTPTCVNLKSAFSDFDGLTRQNRIRYDTPVFAGFQARVSHTDGGAVDAALWYNGKVFDTKIKGAIAYAEASGQTTASVTGDKGNGAKRGGDQINGSLSMQHSSGIGVSFAAGHRNVDGKGAEAGHIDPMMINFGANFDRKFSELGVTSLSGQWQQVENLNRDGDVARVWSLAVVQKIDAAAFEAYASYVNAELEREVTTFGDVDAVMIGGRIKF